MNKRMDFLEIGKIVKAQGLKGRVKVLSYLESGAEMLQSLDEVFISQGKDKHVGFALKNFQVKGKCFYLDLAGIENIDQTAALLGCSVLVPADKMGALPEGEYYWQQLIGLTVMTEAGTLIGTLAEIFPTGSNDVFVCRGGAKEILLPAIADVVLTVDLEKKIMVVRLPEGL
ncbi:MAG: ribosome maturation factor RimM [Deltaproteobacteria bacterium]|nr:ribosome maturation factor RimM [Deltaproteobacteria bacterium]